MMANAFRRASTTSDVGNSTGESSRTPSAPETARRSSIANLSLRLSRSKRSQSSNSTFTRTRTSTNISIVPEKPNRLGELFFSLPSEIQSQVLCYLSLSDIFNVRRTSKTAVDIVNACASSVTRTLLNDLFSPSHAELIFSLYPMPTPLRSTDYLLQTLKRHNTITRTIKVIITFIQMKIYMIKTGPRVERFAQYRDRLAAILYPGAWIIHHFLESYRHRLIYTHPTHPQSRFWDCSTCNTAITTTINTYPALHLVVAYQFYALAILHLRASSRAPTYAGTIERRLRRWSREPASDDNLAQFVVLGGIDHLSQISVMRGTYNDRLENIHGFLDKAASTTSTISHRIAYRADGTKQLLPNTYPQFMTEVDVPFDDITVSIMDSLPGLSDILMPELRNRILDECLVENEDELAAPFKFVQNVMLDDEARQQGGVDGQQWQYQVFSNYGPQLATARLAV